MVFAEQWLAPFVHVRLAESNREQTYTWCTRWWSHRAVAVRVAHLHSAFEFARTARDAGAMSAFLVEHVDLHVRQIMDAANGPLYRCTRAKHVPSPSLPFDPVPPGHFPNLPPSAPEPLPGEVPLVRFTNYVDFAERWLLPVISVRLTGKGREGQYTWCRQWWLHSPVTVRFAAIHRVFEAARRNEDTRAMSSLFTKHIDKHMRHILDAAKGPMHRCTPESHNTVADLPYIQPPVGWFGPDSVVPVEDRGFGPNFMGLRDRRREENT